MFSEKVVNGCGLEVLYSVKYSDNLILYLKRRLRRKETSYLLIPESRIQLRIIFYGYKHH